MEVIIKRLCLVVAYVFATTGISWSQKPKWVGNTPKELNHTYKFVEIVSVGSSIEGARADAKDRLNDDTQLQEGIRIYRKTQEQTDINKTRSTKGDFHETVDTKIHVETTVDGEKFNLQAIRVDEYVNRKGEMLELHTLYMVALCEDPVFDRTYLTTKYGAAPVAMSIIPGLGQWYKGSKAKGAVLFAAEAAAVASVIVCENNRATYIRKMKEQPKFAKEYQNRADNYELGRNVSIGVAAGVWIYNIIDAVAAKGARRVLVKRADGGGLSLMPMATPDGAGVSMAYRF